LVTARADTCTGRKSATKIPHASSIVRPAANTGAVGANDAAKNPPMSGGIELASAAMLEPIPRISPCTCGATDRLSSPPMFASDRPLNVELLGAIRNSQMGDGARRYAHITHATPSSEIFSTCGSLNFAATLRVVTICVKMAHMPTHAKKLPMRASLKLKRLIRNRPKNEMKNPKPALKKNDVRKIVRSSGIA